MVTRAIYVPANHFGRDVLTYIWQHIGCSIGSIRKVDNVLRVSITLPKKEVIRMENILQKFNLL